MLETHLSACPDGFWHFPSPAETLPPTLEEATLIGLNSSGLPLEGSGGHL